MRAILLVAVGCAVGVAGSVWGAPWVASVSATRAAAPPPGVGDFVSQCWRVAGEDGDHVLLRRAATVHWHIDAEGWFTLRWTDHTREPAVQGGRFGLWTPRAQGAPVAGPLPLAGPTFRVLAAEDSVAAGATFEDPTASGQALLPSFDVQKGTFEPGTFTAAKRLDRVSAAELARTELRVRAPDHGLDPCAPR